MAGVEVSTDGGASWHRRPGRPRGPTAGTPTARRRTTIRSRAVDDSGNLESSPPSAASTSAARARWPARTSRRRRSTSSDPGAVELGVRFKADLDGSDHRRPLLQVDRQHRHAHRQPVDDERDAARARDVRERDAPGWQQLTFARRSTSPPARPTSRRTSRRAVTTRPRRRTTSCRAHRRQHARQPAAARISANGGGANGVYSYAGSTTFPSSTYNGENYGVDVVFTPKLPPGSPEQRHGDGRPGSATSTSARRSPAARRRATSSRRSSARPRRRRRPSRAARRRPSVRVSGLDAGDLLHVQGPGRQRQRDESVLGRVERGHADPADGAGRADRPRRPAPATARRRCAGPRPNDGGAHDHALHDHAVPQRRRPAHDRGRPARRRRRPRW